MKHRFWRGALVLALSFALMIPSSVFAISCVPTRGQSFTEWTTGIVQPSGNPATIHMQGVAADVRTTYPFIADTDGSSILLQINGSDLNYLREANLWINAYPDGTWTVVFFATDAIGQVKVNSTFPIAAPGQASWVHAYVHMDNNTGAVTFDWNNGERHGTYGLGAFTWTTYGHHVSVNPIIFNLHSEMWGTPGQNWTANNVSYDSNYGQHVGFQGGSYAYTQNSSYFHASKDQAAGTRLVVYDLNCG